MITGWCVQFVSQIHSFLIMTFSLKRTNNYAIINVMINSHDDSIDYT